MANIANAKNAYVSNGNGKVYSLIQKKYMMHSVCGNTEYMDGYVTVDSQGNFTVKGVYCSPNGNTYQLWFPDDIFSGFWEYGSFTVNQLSYTSQNLYDSNGNNVQGNIANLNAGFIGISISPIQYYDYYNNIKSRPVNSPIYFTVTGNGSVYMNHNI